MDATTVNMEPGTTTLMQSPAAAVTQVNGSGGNGNGSDPSGDKVKRLSAIADRVGCNLVQLQLAWQLRNQVGSLIHFSFIRLSMAFPPGECLQSARSDSETWKTHNFP